MLVNPISSLVLSVTSPQVRQAALKGKAKHAFLASAPARFVGQSSGYTGGSGTMVVLGPLGDRSFKLKKRSRERQRGKFSRELGGLPIGTNS